MDRMYGKLTVYFENPFWVGVFERISNGKLSVCKVTFGAEPKDYKVWEFILKHYYELKFSSAIENVVKQTADNPKRRQCNARKKLHNFGIGTKSQQVLQMQHEERKVECKQIGKEQRETEKQRLFNLKQQKRKKEAQRSLTRLCLQISGLRLVVSRISVILFYTKLKSEQMF